MPVEMQDKYVYNYINWYNAYDICKKLSGTSESVESCQVYGCLWDAVIEYLVKSGNKNYYDVSVISTSWGNYLDATFSYKNLSGNIVIKNEKESVLIPTGSTEYTKACNIYDLAGNVWELVQRNRQGIYKFYYGGLYSSYGSWYPVSFLRVSASVVYTKWCWLSSYSLCQINC